MYQGFSHQFHSQRNNGHVSFQRCSQDTPVPVSKPFSHSDMISYQNSLQVPNGEEVPMGSEYIMDYGRREDFFTCPDGTVLSLKTGKVLQEPKEEGRDAYTWGNRMMDNPFEETGHGTWDDGEINSFNPYVSQNNPCGYHLEGKDLDYQRYSEMKNRELQDNMTDEQRSMLQDLENGRFMRKSRLIEESKKI